VKIYTIEVADNSVAPARLMHVTTSYEKAVQLARNSAERGNDKLLKSVYNHDAGTTVYINVKTNAYGRIVEWEV